MNLSALGVTPAKAKQFAQKGIGSAEELLRYLPKTYRDYTKETGILPETEVSCIVMKVKRFQTSNGKVRTLKAVGSVEPSGEKLVVTWFNQNYLLERFQGVENRAAFVAGKLRYNAQYRQYECANPDLFEPNLSAAKRVFPVYPKIPGMGNDYLSGKIRLASGISELTGETLPYELVTRLGLLSMRETLYKLHFPQSMEQVRQGQRRLLFDDLLFFALQQEWSSRRSAAESLMRITNRGMMYDILSSLPYVLTDDQRTAVAAMLDRAEQGARINALVQGDVGCGKTIIAFLMMAAFAGSGYQTVLMAPTQVLARQHFKDLSPLLEPLGVEAVCLSCGEKASERKKALEKIASGSARFVVGTRSLIAGDVRYANLALVITDEEHRFGVAQRGALVEKAAGGVHCITMSATPIPRSLAQVLYGSAVQLHTIRTMPRGRVPVRTGISAGRERIYQFLLSQTHKGHQAYVVCPRIERNEEKQTVKSVEEVSQEYIEALAPKGVRIATITGKDSREKAEQVIQAFQNRETDILISTTVIEVGVNVPNATVMVISSAEQFGLSSLHQLRGRVGRSQFQSYCILESEHMTEKGWERLKAMCETTDGFAIAEADLKIRGAGDFIGTRQSGENKYMALMLAYPEEYAQAQSIARELLEAGSDCPLVLQAKQETEKV